MTTPAMTAQEALRADAARAAHETERREWIAIHYEDDWAAIRTGGSIREPMPGDDWRPFSSQDQAEDYIDQRAWRVALAAAERRATEAEAEIADRQVSEQKTVGAWIAETDARKAAEAGWKIAAADCNDLQSRLAAAEARCAKMREAHELIRDVAVDVALILGHMPPDYAIQEFSEDTQGRLLQWIIDNQEARDERLLASLKRLEPFRQSILAYPGGKSMTERRLPENILQLDLLVACAKPASGQNSARVAAGLVRDYIANLIRERDEARKHIKRLYDQLMERGISGGHSIDEDAALYAAHNWLEANPG